MPYVPLTWLADHVQLTRGADAQRLAADLVRVGLEEESIVPPKVQGPLVVGRVLTMVKEKHSNGKTVNYCRVDVGQHNDAPGTGKEAADIPSRGIVCGAHNFEVGDLVAVVLPGAVLPGPFPISARKTYGHFSDGMICSERELEMSDEHAGILVLTEKYAAEELPAIGEDLTELFGLNQEVLEINVTPDRGYCFSMRGIAREYSHSTGMPFTDPGLPGAVGGVPEPNADGFPVVVTDDTPIRGAVGCDRFVTRIVRGINPNAPSPQWMVDRLEQAGMRAISLAVDVTNFVMLDLGQPLHAYDLAALSAPIVVRRAKRGERLVTLDEVDRPLHPEDLLITDSPDDQTGSRIIGLAGVMGGRYSEVEEATTDVLIEAAHFDPVTIARSARRHRLPSEASKRFERGVDTQLQAVAAQRVANLLVEYGGGTIDPAVTDLNNTTTPEPISMAVWEPARLIGVDYLQEEIVSILRSIGCEVEKTPDTDLLQVTPPSWRSDLVGPAHLVEEIARLAGYDTIPSIVPEAPAGRGYTPAQKARRAIAAELAARGLTEVKSYPFIGDVHDRMGLPEDDERRQVVRLANPLQEDSAGMRTSILDSLLETATRNVSRGLGDLALYEMGVVTRPLGTEICALPGAETRPSDEVLRALQRGVPRQPWHIGVVLTGAGEPAGVLGAGRPADWADAVETVRAVASALGAKVRVRQGSQAPWHPGRCAEVYVGGGPKATVVAVAGELHPRVCATFDLPARSCAVEIDLDALMRAAKLAPVQVKPISTFPLAKEDIALVVADTVPATEVETLVRKAVGELAEEVRVFDVYTGSQLEPGMKSLAVSMRMRASNRTLTAKETEEVRRRVLLQTGRRFGATLRA